MPEQNSTNGQRQSKWLITFFLIKLNQKNILFVFLFKRFLLNYKLNTKFFFNRDYKIK